MADGYQIFISAKNLDAAGHPTQDRELAHGLWEFLTDLGYRVFFSNVSLERMGESDYTRVIDDALDQAQILVVVCTDGAHVDTRWVRYEWDSFLNDMRSGLKPEGRVFVYLSDESIPNLPRGLRHTQCVEHDGDGFRRLARFINSATGGMDADPAAVSARPEAVGDLPDVSGDWEGEWRRSTGRIGHRGHLSIRQAGNRLGARMRVTFDKADATTVVDEILRGLVTPHNVVLQGEEFAYVERGASRSYLLDHFELELEPDGNVLAGVFYSRNGRGVALFRRTKKRSMLDDRKAG